jgi:hypothetical protein
MSQPDVAASQQEAAQKPKNLRETVSVVSRLAPKQLNDELQLTLRQLQSKGVSLGVSAALVVGGLVFLSLVMIALVVAAIAGLATVMPLWLSALVVAVVFLIIGGLLAGIGALRAKNTLPEAAAIPKQAMLRVQHDLGVLREGTAFDPATLAAPKPAKPAKKGEAPVPASQQPQVKAPKPTEAELRRRLARRREHLAQLRDTFGEQTDVKARFGAAAQRFSAATSRATSQAKDGLDRAQVGLSDTVNDREQLRATAEKVGPWVVVSLAATAVVLFVRRLFRKAK